MSEHETDERHAPTVADQAVIRESITMGLYITISLLASSRPNPTAIRAPC
jgi:hypothetical protein